MGAVTVLGDGSWRDERTGVSERATHVVVGGGRVMVQLHLPAVPPKAGVLICSAIGREQMRHYHREVLLGRALAGLGLAVARFEWRGTGNSDTTAVDHPSVTSMAEDAETVAQHLQDAAGLDRLGFLAEAMGAIPAARVAAKRPGAPLMLLEPVVRPRSYYRTLHRVRLASEALDGAADWALRQGLEEALAEHGYADVLGYRLDASAYESVARLDLAAELGSAPRPVMVVQLDKRPDLRPELARFVRTLADAGLDTESTVAQTEHAWWFIPKWEAELEQEEDAALMPVITDWLHRRLVGVGARMEVL